MSSQATRGRDRPDRLGRPASSVSLRMGSSDSPASDCWHYALAGGFLPPRLSVLNSSSSSASCAVAASHSGPPQAAVRRRQRARWSRTRSSSSSGRALLRATFLPGRAAPAPEGAEPGPSPTRAEGKGHRCYRRSLVARLWDEGQRTRRARLIAGYGPPMDLRRGLSRGEGEGPGPEVPQETLNLLEIGHGSLPCATARDGLRTDSPGIRRVPGGT